MSEAVFSRLLTLPEYGAARTVMAYCGFGSEPETGMFLKAVPGGGKRLILPRVERETRTLVLREVGDPDSELVAGVWGIMEPIESLPEVRIEDVDFVLMPGVAFDEAGGRLGYGGGFYDRLLGGLGERPPGERPPGGRPRLVAAAFGVQVVGRVPTGAHDVRVDAVVTEDGVVRFGG